MGAWGTAIFSDDLAADVRGEWRELLLDGAETEAAATTVKERFRYAVDEEDDSVVFWLALAAAQMETGRPKRLRREKPLGVRFELGDVLLLRSESGKRRALTVVVAQNDGYPRGTVDPVLELLAWDGGALPTRRQMQTMPTVKHLNDLPPGREPHLRPHLWVVFTARKDQIFTAESARSSSEGCTANPAETLGAPTSGPTSGPLGWRGPRSADTSTMSTPRSFGSRSPTSGRAASRGRFGADGADRPRSEEAPPDGGASRVSGGGLRP